MIGALALTESRWVGEFEAPKSPTFLGFRRALWRRRRLDAPDIFGSKTHSHLRRQDRLVGWRPSKPGKQRGDKAHILDALRDEIKQLSDLLEHLNKRELHHLTGLARCLGMLIATGEPLPLLQLYAANENAPLLVYTSNRPFKKGMDKADFTVSIEIWLPPTQIHTNPIDLDVWLDSPWGQMNGKPISNRQILTGIRHTIAAHFDQDILPEVIWLRSLSVASDYGSITREVLLNFLIRIGTAVQQLGRSVLAIS